MTDLHQERKAPSAGTHARRLSWRKAAAVTAAAASVGTVVLAISPGTAQAAVASSAPHRYCGVAATGRPGTQGYKATPPYFKLRTTGTIWTKRSDTCHDLNLVMSDADDYTGWYQSGGTWHEGSRGEVFSDWAQQDRVLLSDVRPGARMTITSAGLQTPSGEKVYIDY